MLSHVAQIVWVEASTWPQSQRGKVVRTNAGDGCVIRRKGSAMTAIN